MIAIRKLSCVGDSILFVCAPTFLQAMGLFRVSVSFFRVVRGTYSNAVEEGIFPKGEIPKSRITRGL